ncbi:MAG: SAM-dependent methyltransferase, partial [Prochlorococcus sp.]
MAPPSLTKLAYQTLQQSKTLAGLAHKEVSTKLMELLAPGAMPSIEKVPAEMLKELRRSMTDLEQIDWQEAEQGIYPKTQLFDAPWLEWAQRY